MKDYPKLTEDKLDEIIGNLLEEKSINEKEKEVLLAYKTKKNVSFLRKIKDLKVSINKLQLTDGFDSLSKEILDLYTEIMRQYPTTGPSSIFNGLIK
ncbi:hypothetical protein [uncultured Anaerococcus sp.]|uniref:hypothetical protein n=1 Tax=uncultured Anaerococcus sp. TaxID=293428 RepID=UPI00288A860E|nr:hypothetical protein [uncultured Anaerococcus sp.]